MKSVVNIIPDVSTEKERRAFINICANENDTELRIKLQNKGIRKEPEFKIPGDHQDYEKLDLKVDLLL